MGWVGSVVVPVALRSGRKDATGSAAADPGIDATDTASATPPDITIHTDAPPPTSSATPPERFWPLHEPRVVLHTSGTTGAPRPVTLTTGQLLLSAFGSATRLGHDPNDHWLCCLPLHHVAGISILMRCAFYGTAVVLHERFDATRVAAALDAGDVTLVSLVPSMLEQVLDARGDGPFPSGLRAILLGGDPPSDALLERCRTMDAPVALTWGMTETASQVATRAPGDFAAASDGAPPLPFLRVRTQGERLVVTGPVVRGGAHVTSDLGGVTDRGRVRVTGRADDAILSGGEIIVPEEIEAVLAGHPAIAQVAVVAVPSERWGQCPAAVLVAKAKSGPHPTAEALSAWCHKRLSGYKVPATFQWRDALPTTALGKIARAQLRQSLVTEGSAHRGLDTDHRMNEGQHE